MSEILDTSSLSRRSFLVKSALTAGTLAGAGALLDACGGDSTGTASTTTITTNFAAAEITPADLAGFAKLYPNIKVQLLAPNANINALFAAGTPPDVYRVNGATDFPYFAARGLSTDLQSRFTASSSSSLAASNLQPVNNIFQWNGKIAGQGDQYGVVKDWSPDATIWYNKKLFDQAGIPYPSATQPMSFNELLTLGKKLTVRQGGKIQVYGLDLAWYANFTYGQIVQWLAQDGKSLFNSDFTQCDFTQPEVKQILQFYVDWAQAHVGWSPLDVETQNWFTLYPANRMAMVMLGYFFGGFVEQTNPSFMQQYAGLAPAPQWGATRVSSCFTGTGGVIPRLSKNQDAAWKFMEYYFGGTAAAARAKTGTGVPALKSLFANLPQSEAYQKEAYQVLQSELQYNKTLQFTSYSDAPGISAAISQYLTPVMQGRTTLDTAARQLTDAVNLLLQQGKAQTS
jgi:multiple sugar transport system substrate-binding protein